MSDLMSKLSMRRKGISGDKSGQESGAMGAMDRISSMIPPPPPAGQDDDEDVSDDNDDDWE